MSDPAPLAESKAPQQDGGARSRALAALDSGADARIVSLCAELTDLGYDPGEELQRRLAIWFGDRATAALPSAIGFAALPASGHLPLEPLYGQRPPRLWPQRPKRRHGELLSSWLWRTAAAAQAPPRLFLRDLNLHQLDDLDRDLAPVGLRRLAAASGQTMAQLASGLMHPAARLTEDPAEDEVEDLLLSDGRFLLAANGRDRLGRPRTLLQYCPRCLSEPATRHFRRSWRLAPVAVCDLHGCRLHDACWRCGATHQPLAQRSAGPEPRCRRCDADLGAAAIRPAVGARARQRALLRMLRYVGAKMAASERARHLDAVATRFGDARAPAAIRIRSLLALKPASWREWFAEPLRAKHGDALSALADGTQTASRCATPAERRHRKRTVVTR